MEFPTFYEPADPTTFSIHQVPKIFFNEPNTRYVDARKDWQQVERNQQLLDEYQDAQAFKESMQGAFQDNPNLSMEEAMEIAGPMMVEHGRMEEWFKLQDAKEQADRQELLDQSRILQVATTIRNASPDDTLSNQFLASVGREDLVGKLDLLQDDQIQQYSQGGDVYEWNKTTGERRLVQAGRTDKPYYQPWHHVTTGEPIKVNINSTEDMQEKFRMGYESPTMRRGGSQDTDAQIMQFMSGRRPLPPVGFNAERAGMVERPQGREVPPEVQQRMEERDAQQTQRLEQQAAGRRRAKVLELK